MSKKVIINFKISEAKRKELKEAARKLVEKHFGNDLKQCGVCGADNCIYNEHCINCNIQF